MLPETLELIVCPLCTAPLDHDRDQAVLICKVDRLVFPIQNGVPLLIESEAHPLVEGV